MSAVGASDPIWRGIDDYNRFTYPESVTANGIFNMPVRVTAGSQTLGPVQVEITYDVLKYEVLSISGGELWQDGQLMWTVDVPFGTLLVGGLQYSAAAGPVDIVIVKLRARGQLRTLDASRFTSRIISAYDSA